MTWTEYMKDMEERGANLAGQSIESMMTLVWEDTGEYPDWDDEIPDWIQY